MKQKECVVIGAGLAGLAAAYRLSQKNWSVTVLEAADRIGGRVMTYHFAGAPGLNCELGGEWIGSDHKEMRRLCKQLRLPLQKHQYANSFWNETARARLIAPGAWCMSPKSDTIWKNFQKQFKTSTPQQSIYRIVSCERFLKILRDREMASLRRQRILYAEQGWNNSRDLKIPHRKNGNDYLHLSRRKDSNHQKRIDRQLR